MLVSEAQYKVMPPAIQAMFTKQPNHGSDEVVREFPTQNGKVGMTQHGSGTNSVYGKYQRSEASVRNDGTSDTGSAARFFKCCQFTEDERCERANTADTSSSQPNEQDGSALSGAATSDSLAGQHRATGPSQATADCTGSCNSSAPSPSLARNAADPASTDTTPTTASRSKSSGSAPPVTDERINSGGSDRTTSTEPARFVYVPKASRAERNAGCETTNGHPCVKPIALMRYLCRLTKTPTGGTVLDPFAGSGSTLIAAVQEGRHCIGIEQDEAYCKIAAKRLDHAIGEAADNGPDLFDNTEAT